MAEVVIPLGKHAKLYYDAPGTAAPANEIAGARDVTVTMDKEEAMANRRVSGCYADARPGTRDLTITFDIVVVMSAGSEKNVIDILRKTFLTDMYNAVGDTGIALHAVTGLLADGGEGPLADFILRRFERTESLADVQVYACEARMTQSQGRTPPIVWQAAPA